MVKLSMRHAGRIALILALATGARRASGQARRSTETGAASETSSTTITSGIAEVLMEPVASRVGNRWARFAECLLREESQTRRDAEMFLAKLARWPREHASPQAATP